MLNERTTSSIPPPAHAVGSAVICPGTRPAAPAFPFVVSPFPPFVVSRLVGYRCRLRWKHERRGGGRLKWRLERGEGRPGGRERGREGGCSLSCGQRTNPATNEPRRILLPLLLRRGWRWPATRSFGFVRLLGRDGRALIHERERGRRRMGAGRGGREEAAKRRTQNRRRRDPPRALPTSNSFTADGRLLQSGSSSVQFWTLHHHRRPPRGITRIERGE